MFKQKNILEVLLHMLFRGKYISNTVHVAERFYSLNFYSMANTGWKRSLGTSKRQQGIKTPKDISWKESVEKRKADKEDRLPRKKRK